MKDPNSLALVIGSRQASNANLRSSAFALSTLLSMTEEQLEHIGDHDELALFAKKIKHISNNRKER